ncbi:MAG TPA: VOC family protein [Vicinamibacteria bacterium]|nr:VOC family protein [Vicinamibacteria bacterium]
MGPVITDSHFVIAVADLDKSAAYYRDVLGFAVRDMGDPGWRMLVKDRCTIMAGECPDAIPPTQLGDHSYFAYFVIDGIDDYYQGVVARGARIRKPVRDEPWKMREFAVETIDGHRIMFGSRLQ